jgi:hypothetical protein
MLQRIICQLATVIWQQPPVGNDKKMNQSQKHPRAFIKCKNSFPCHYEWNAASLFLSTFVGFKNNWILTRKVCLVNKTCQ